MLRNIFSEKEFKSLIISMTKVREEDKRKKERESFLKKSSADILVAKAQEIQELIDAEHQKGIRESNRLDYLHDFSAGVEDSLWRRLFGGERLKKEVIIGRKVFPSECVEYAFVNFHRHRSIDVSTALFGGIDGEPLTDSAITYLPRITDFANALGRMKGELFLLTQHSSKYGYENEFNLSFALKGIVHGTPQFKINRMGEYHHRSLLLPLKDAQIASTKGWKEYPQKGFDINTEFVEVSSESLVLPRVGKVPEKIILSYKSGPYIGGSTAFVSHDMYVGNRAVEERFKSGLVFKVQEEVNIQL